ncbi:MAG: hypothetical protein K8R58_05380 [Bacteroidales bacterium]|nr:hypothetical protein [Bacteroidales bacterium]
MILNKRHIIILIALQISLFLNSVNAQYYSLGQDPASLKWRQINTGHFKIIYPDKFEQHSQKLINFLEYAYLKISKTLDHTPKKTPVIIHSRSVTSNALVIWAPKRMEFYSCPPQNSNAEQWIEQLSIHEYRHVVQISKLNKGISKTLYYLFGEQGTAGLLGLFIPPWFLEGDAVATETALSKSGRGRLPSFEMKLRTQVLEKGIFSYDKAVLGSFKEFVPNCYVLGYNLVAFARKKYGYQIWSNTLNNVAKKPFIITPFSNGIRKNTGLGKNGLYKSSLLELKNLWKAQKKDLDYTEFNLITNPSPKNYTDYSMPGYINDSIVLALRTGIDDISRFISIDKKGSEKILFTPGFYLPGSLSYSKNLIIWAEKQYDLRWQNRNYSVIKTYNIKTKKIRQITSKTRFFAPAISNSAEEIVCVEVSPENNYALVLLNAGSGEVIRKISTDDNVFFMTPTWADNDKSIVSIVLNNKGKSIALINTENSEIQYMIPFSFTEISKPVMFNNYILFIGAYSGIDNIYALDILTKQIYQVTSAMYGVADPDISADGRKIIYSNYTDNGYKIVEIDFDTNNWKPLDKVNDNSIKLYKSIVEQEGGIIDAEDIIQKKYESKKYSKWKNLVNIHSWAPVFIDIDNTSVNPGVSIMSQNLLSTTFATLGYDYNINEELGRYYANISYKGFYPVFDFEFDYGKRKGYYKNEKEQKIKFLWNETNIKTGILLPLNLTKGKYQRKIQPQIRMTYKLLDINETCDNVFKETNFKTIDYNIYAYNFIKSVAKDMYPKWGQVLVVNYKNTPFDNNDKSCISSIESYLYFPGLFNHHSLKLYAGIQNRKYAKYYFSDLINYPRGFYDQYNDELYSISFNYKLPVLYPDLSLGSLVYMKSVKANLFYDYASGKNNYQNNIYRSTGIEITSDLHLLRIIFPFDIGLRAIYIPDENTINYELLFAMKFGSL